MNTEEMLIQATDMLAKVKPGLNAIQESTVSDIIFELDKILMEIGEEDE